MFKDTSKDIYSELDFMPITLLSNNLRIGVIGGGQGALIKVKTFLSKGCIVEVIALDFIEEFYKIDNLKLDKVQYNREFILDKHIIVIAINDKVVVQEIINDCKQLSKIYINSTNFKDGMGIIPVSRKCENITIAVNTNVGNPKASVMVAEYLINHLKPMDKFIGFTAIIRNNLDIDKEAKKEVLSFINTIDFKDFYDKDKHYNVLSLFYEKDLIDKIKALK